LHIADLPTEDAEFPESSENARRWGFRSILCVPLMREGVAIGTIALRRREVQLFTERQVALLQTFADQAVIAIENARLFEEVKARTEELSESLQQQTATADVLKVISRSTLCSTPATPLPTSVMNSRRLMAMLNPMTEAARVSRLGPTAAPNKFNRSERRQSVHHRLPARGGCILRKNEVRLQRDEFRRVSLHCLRFKRRPASVDPDVAALRPPELLESLAECCDPGLCFRVALGKRHQHADPAHPFGLLRARRERPTESRAAEDRDEFARRFTRSPRGQAGSAAQRFPCFRRKG
jgi:hypothetical protein